MSPRGPLNLACPCEQTLPCGLEPILSADAPAPGSASAQSAQSHSLRAWLCTDGTCRLRSRHRSLNRVAKRIPDWTAVGFRFAQHHCRAAHNPRTGGIAARLCCCMLPDPFLESLFRLLRYRRIVKTAGSDRPHLHESFTRVADSITFGGINPSCH